MKKLSHSASEANKKDNCTINLKLAEIEWYEI